MKKKILFAFVIIIFAIFFAALFVYAKDNWMWQTYRNEEYGFQLKMPPTWKNVNIYKMESPPQAIFHTVDFFFELPLKDPIIYDNGVSNTYGVFFNISIASKNEWKKIQNEEGPVPGYLAETNDRVFGYSTTNDTPPFRDVDADQIFLKDLPKVIKSLKVWRVDKDIAEGWREFKSTHFGYTVYYPQTWFAQSSQYDRSDDFVNEEPSAPLAMSEKGVWVTVTALPKNNKTLEEVIQNFRKENITEQRYEIVLEEAIDIVGSQSALRLREEYLEAAPDSEGLPFIAFYIDHGDVVYRASVLYNSEEAYKNNEPIIKQILGTIKNDSA